MEIKERIEIIKGAVEKYGEEAQKRQAVEELGELIVALAREGRGRSSVEDIATEIADVTIMCWQLSYIYGPTIVQQEVDYKLNRLRERMG